MYFLKKYILYIFATMISNREFVSRVSVGMRSISKDLAIPPRYVLSIGRIKAKDIMIQKLDELTLNKEEGIKTSIECFEMNRIKYKDCGVIEFKVCDTIMRSCKKLPETLFGKSGTGVLRVSSIDSRKDYRYITPKDYTRLKRRKYKNSLSRYFSIKDGYLLYQIPQQNL